MYFTRVKSAIYQAQQWNFSTGKTPLLSLDLV
jgi:hypothetical protein